MIKRLRLKLTPSEAANEHSVKQVIAANETISLNSVTGYHILKHSIDARGKQVWIYMDVQAFLNQPFQPRETLNFYFHDVSGSPSSVVIIGAGPAGLFAALKFIEAGVKPVIIERGKDVRARRRDLALLNKEGEVNPESNYCFGEGGAGTYSDGKLYTRSSKRGDINRILQLFHHFGADERILYESHPHIGTNKLPGIITAMRQQITAAGGEIHFNQKATGFRIIKNKVSAVTTATGDEFPCEACILATGHSARDIFSMLHENNLLIESKSFALGVRVEHPQTIIDAAQYHCSVRDKFLPPAAYSLVQQVEGKGVFSFCMCPGGIIAPAATSPGELVVNGWSPSKRNNPFANSGIVVTVETDRLKSFSRYGALAGMEFQRSIEQKAFEAGGGKFVAPAQRLVDFTSGKISSDLPDCSYQPGISSADLKQVLPPFIHNSLRLAFKEFGKKMKGYLTNEAVVVATESRTSSPVRIPRTDNLHHPQLINLYPCAEGAGYAGGIVSAAMDGEKIASRIISILA